MKVLLTGAGGQVGLAVQANVPSGITLVPLRREQLDITRQAAVESLVRELSPALIINAAAYTAVDRAELEPQRAFDINAEGARYLALAARAIPGCRLIQISTDYVFDGTRPGAYGPGDPANPVSVYGHSKLAGEHAVLEALAERSVILRTAWIYAPRGRNFLLTMLRLMREHSAVRVVSDQLGSPTSARSIATALWTLAARSGIGGGILHWTDGGTGSWYDFAVAIAAEAHTAGLLAHRPQVTAITTAEYPTPARRPVNSVLDSSDAVRQLGFAPPPWRQELHDTIQALR